MQSAAKARPSQGLEVQEKKLGEGSVAEVYAGLFNQKMVAIKRFKKESTDRFEREAKNILKLNPEHTNTWCTVSDFKKTPLKNIQQR